MAGLALASDPAPQAVAGHAQIPSNIDAEQALLGAILLENSIFEEISGIVTGETFYEPLHAQIYGLFADMLRNDRVVNPITASLAFRDHPTLKDQGGGRKYLAELALAACDAYSAADYARTLADLACCRGIIQLADEAKAKALDRSVGAQDWSEIAGSMGMQIEMLSAGMRDDRVMTGEQVINDLAAILEAGVELMPTGIKRLDESFGGGFRKGKLYAFEGQAKRFKTGFLSAIFEGLIKAGTPVMLISLEMSPNDVFQRQVAGHNGMSFLALENKRFKDRNVQRCFDYQTDMGGLANVYLMHVPGASHSEIMSYVSRAKTKYGVEVVLIDYWQRIRGEMMNKTEAANLEAIANHLADLLEKIGIAGVLASQLNRNDASLGSDGLQRACSWRAKINQVDLDENERGDIDTGLWLEVSENRYGPRGHVGDEDNPAFSIAPGPVLMELAA